MGNMLAKLGNMLSEGLTPTPAAEVIAAIRPWVTPILGVLLGLGILLAIWIGVRLATAQDESKRKEAKAQLIWAIIAVFIVGMGIAVMEVLATTIGSQTL